MFVDTGAWYALCDASDQYHADAAAHARKLAKENATMVTTNLVVHETFTLLSRKVSRRAAIAFIDELRATDKVRILLSDAVLEEEALGIIRKHGDQDFSMTDAVSFAVMRRESIRRAFTFDRHFSTMRFSVEPQV